MIILANNSLSGFVKKPNLDDMSLESKRIKVEENLKIYLKNIENGIYLMRIMNNDDKKTKKFLMNYKYQEMSLTGTQTKKKMNEKKLNWNVEDSKSKIIKTDKPISKATTIIGNFYMNTE